MPRWRPISLFLEGQRFLFDVGEAVARTEWELASSVFDDEPLGYFPLKRKTRPQNAIVRTEALQILEIIRSLSSDVTYAAIWNELKRRGLFERGQLFHKRTERQIKYRIGLVNFGINDPVVSP